ncbi:MAG: hypothetical protein K6E91_07125 [Butyrivibrio sp.]|nr:hypothetical protein [Butyrivibrio sp.]
MEKGSSGSAVVKSVVLVVLAAVVILGVYLVLTRNKTPGKDENYELTVVDEITTTDLERNYPASARKVVDLYAKSMQVLYKETYSDTQCDQMIAVVKGILDQELLDNNLNFEQSLKNEIKQRKQEDYSISNYVVQTKEPDEVLVDGLKMCNVDCLFSLRHGTNGTTATYYQFILRRDYISGNWKILGWTVKESE